jgi:hypothetical protein
MIERNQTPGANTPMPAKPNYEFLKRQKEQAKQKKKEQKLEEKRLKKAENPEQSDTDENAA